MLLVLCLLALFLIRAAIGACTDEFLTNEDLEVSEQIEAGIMKQLIQARDRAAKTGELK